MKIVHVLWSIRLADGGVVRAILDLCPELANQGHSVTVLTSRDEDAPASWKTNPPTPGVPHIVHLPDPHRLFGSPASAMAIARREVADADVVHAHGMWLPSTDQIAAAALDLNTPVIYTPHGMLDDWSMQQGTLKKRIYHALRSRRLLERSAFVHCTAQAELDQASKWFPRGRGVVIPLIFDLAPYAALPGPDLARTTLGVAESAPRVPLILFLSRIHEKKGIESLILAVERLAASGTPCRLAIAGGGEAAYVQRIKDMVKSRQLDNLVTFVGFVSGDVKTSLYQAADMFVLPSSQENFGYVVVEAMAAGTPVITTTGVALWPELKRDGVAVLSEPTPDALVAEIGKLLADPAGARNLGQRGREWVFKHMDRGAIINQFIDLYRRAAATRTGAPRT